MLNPAEVAATTLATNADYDETGEVSRFVAAATPTLLVRGTSDEKLGREVLITAELGMRHPDGGWAEAEVIHPAEWVARRDGRLGPDEVARRRFRGLIAQAEAAGLAVEVVRGR